VPQEKMEYYCELIAAIKVRTSNKKGRHLSTGEAIRLIEKFGIETPDGLVKAPESTFKKSTVNRYLQRWGYDRETLRRQPAAVRFQAEHSNDCWQFDELARRRLSDAYGQLEAGAPTVDFAQYHPRAHQRHQHTIRTFYGFRACDSAASRLLLKEIAGLVR